MDDGSIQRVVKAITPMVPQMKTICVCRVGVIRERGFSNGQGIIRNIPSRNRYARNGMN